MTARLILVASFVLVAAAPAASQPQYTITDLGTLPGRDFSWATRVSESGHVLGGTRGADGTYPLFLWKDGVLTALDPFPGVVQMNGTALNASGQAVGYGSFANRKFQAFFYDGDTISGIDTAGASDVATDINASGQVVGFSWTSDPRYLRAFRYSNGTTTELPPLPGGDSSVAYAINDAGQVAGGSRQASGVWHAVTWAGGVPTDLGTIGGGGAVARGLNEAGQVAGLVLVPAPGGSSAEHAFSYDNGAATDLGTFGGLHSFPHDINDAGEVVGWADSEVGEQAFLYSAGRMINLGALSGSERSVAYAVNSAGHVVGLAQNPEYYAFVYAAGTFHSLATLIPDGSGWDFLIGATDINDAGQIVGWGQRDGKLRAFRLDPLQR